MSDGVKIALCTNHGAKLYESITHALGKYMEADGALGSEACAILEWHANAMSARMHAGFMQARAHEMTPLVRPAPANLRIVPPNGNGERK